jgi:hypothetical protein
VDKSGSRLYGGEERAKATQIEHTNGNVNIKVYRSPKIADAQMKDERMVYVSPSYSCSALLGWRPFDI